MKISKIVSLTGVVCLQFAFATTAFAVITGSDPQFTNRTNSQTIPKQSSEKADSMADLLRPNANVKSPRDVQSGQSEGKRQQETDNKLKVNTPSNLKPSSVTTKVNTDKKKNNNENNNKPNAQPKDTANTGNTGGNGKQPTSNSDDFKAGSLKKATTKEKSPNLQEKVKTEKSKK